MDGVSINTKIRSDAIEVEFNGNNILASVYLIWKLLCLCWELAATNYASLEWNHKGLKNISTSSQECDHDWKMELGHPICTKCGVQESV